MTVFLNAASYKAKLGKLSEATKDLAQCKNWFRKEPGASDRISITEADIALKRGNVKSALQLLKTVRAGSPLYMSAKVKMAHIYLTSRKQRKLYSQCYEEIVKKNPTIHNWILLGDAYGHSKPKKYFFLKFLEDLCRCVGAAPYGMKPHQRLTFL
jgi:predicted Zn-dependent protease